MGSSADRDDLGCSLCGGGQGDILCLSCKKEFALSFCGSCQHWDGEYLTGGHIVEGRCTIRACPEVGITAGVRWAKCDKHKPFPQAKPLELEIPSICLSCAESCPGKHAYREEQDSQQGWACALFRPKPPSPEVDSKIAAGSKKSAPFMFALAELQYAAMMIDGNAIAMSEDRRSVALGFWLRRRREGPFIRNHKARPLAISAYFLLWEMVAAEGADPYSALPEVWKVSLFGEGKHGANNWMNAKPEGMHYYEGALWRHIIESTWEEKAEDSGCYHLAHAVWNALMLLEMEMRGVVNPDWESDDESSDYHLERQDR